ncbi:spore coat protein U domain-containing protein [Geotalea sp. SG265]|uniref:Csu type fimbrial protein n=1 Tax=Geotalea sp. SG265 TaxID=2922867 RepID=UPI001FAE8E3B|nr:spore coat protein U domain-containing protein [Geotalea sp. SG265]
MVKSFIKNIVIMLCLLLCRNAIAGTVNGTTTTTTTIAQYCTATIGSGATLSLAYSGDDSSTSTYVDIQCSNGTPWVISVDGGTHALGELRRAYVNSSGDRYVPYRLYSDVNGSNELQITTNNTINGIGVATAATASQKVYLYMKVLHSDINPSVLFGVGYYTDTITVNLFF